VYPLRYEPGITRVDREEFVAALNAEGALFYQGYVEPLYLQPLYQQQSLFKHSYPFSAPENRGHTARYEKGTCSVAELLHQKTMIINEHIRFPHKKRDIEQLIQIVIKVTG
jgi:dTDP-4-amino-4,6-dideoxygalactose transaminase